VDVCDFIVMQIGADCLYKIEQQARGLAAHRAISCFGHTAVDLALDPIQLPSGRSAYSDLKSISPDGEIMY